MTLCSILDLVYEGNEVGLVSECEATSRLDCNFDFLWYPFDEQVCSIRIHITNVPKSFVQMIPSQAKSFIVHNSTESSGNPKYDLILTKVEASDNWCCINFVMKRNPSCHIIGTYVPVTLLHLIGYGTLFIRADHFQDRGTMSLTTLLVLISLFNESTSSLPSTSYLKFIDVWFLFSVIFLSLIILVHLITNDSTVKVESYEKRETRIKRPSNMSILKNMRKVFGISYVIFISSYCFIVLFKESHTN